jgi:hypothetical protein|tara:strand:- start:276 stop:494 length:219 start_codon:yes stop_codon:yes gene_type:complete
MEELIEGVDKSCFIIGLLRTIEDRMPKAQRKRITNARLVADWLLLRTSRGGRTSCIEQCKKLGIDPDAYTVY